MEDHWQKFEELTAEKLMDEIEMLNKKLFKMKPGSGTFMQMRKVIDMAATVYNDKMALTRLQGQEKDTVMNIGEIEEEVIEPDYGDNILDVVVSSYVSNLKDNKL